MSRIVACALLCASSFASFTAYAGSTAAASVGGLRIQLIDLNPTDGIAPSFSFLNGGKTALSVFAQDSAVGDSDSLSRTRTGTFTYNSTLQSLLDNVSAKAVSTPTTLKASGVASGQGTNFSASASTGSGVNSSYPYLYPPYYPYPSVSNIMLSANTVAIISADASVSAVATPPSVCSPNSGYYGCSVTDSASARAQLGLYYSYSTADGSTSYNFSDTLAVTASSTSSSYYGYVGYDRYGYPIYGSVLTPGTTNSKSSEGTLKVVFTNSSNQSQSGSLYLASTVSGQGSSPSLVPEPEAYALAIAGAAVVAVTTRRRRG